MPEPTIKELNESIEALTSYRDRLKQEITSISRKLHMPQKKVESSLKEHSELKDIEIALQKLLNQRESSNSK